MGRVASAVSLVVVAFLAGITACSDPPSGLKHTVGDSLPATDSLRGLVLSAPVPSSMAAAGRVGASALGSPGSPDVIYISLAPGSVPTGLHATIRDLVSGESVMTGVVDGGFDPVAISASVGDSVVVEIKRTGSTGPIRVVQLVTATRPPVVVRTVPPPKKVDVPLNAVIAVVFSAPIDSATLSTGSVQLWGGSTPVAGTVRLNDTSGFRAEFHPDTPLARETVYDLVVTQAIHDLNGRALGSSVDVQFATGVNEEPLAFTALSVADGHTCGVTTNGAAYCWGINSEGQLGTTTSSDCGIRCSMIPAPVDGGLTFQSLSAGVFHTCGVTTNGAAYCWGSTTYGALGADTTALNTCYASTSGVGCPYPVPVAGGLTFRWISAGRDHTCGVTTQGAAYCWGRGSDGELGADSATLAVSCRTVYGCSTPVPVAGGLTFTSVSAGNALTCGVTTTGAAYCWGTNDAGQLGIGTAAGPDQCNASPGGPGYSCSRIPVAVVGGLAFTAVTALDASACGLTTAGFVYCWGYNAGLLGTGVPLDSFASAPVRTGGDFPFTSIAAGLQYACGVPTTGAAVCWGIGDNGVFGDGTTIHISLTPLEVAGGHAFQALSAANGRLGHSCGLTTDGVAYCWGSNVVGELGNGSTNSSLVPVEVVGQQDNR
jgi:alpha-tubulin suppressor-like RCC1 family protein